MPKAQERDEIARLVELHSKTELRRRYGTADLTELVRQGRINKELAFKAGLLRLADGLDADRRRASKNTQGESYADVKRRLETDVSESERKIALAHWEGHRGIERCDVEPSDGKIAIKIRINPASATSNSTQVAFKALDVLHELQTTPLKRHAVVVFQSSDGKRLNTWYERNKDTLAPGLSGLDVYLEEVKEGE